MTDTSEHLEREIEARRASVEDTLERLKDRMSLDRIMDEVGSFVGMPDMRAALRTAGDTVRQNPVALGLIGAGVAWMFLAPRLANGKHGDDDHLADYSSMDHYGRSRGDHGIADRVGDAVSGAADSLKTRVGDAVGGAADSLKARASDIGDSAASMAGRIRDGAQRVVAPMTGQMEAHPLVMGAVAMAAGALVGSALPRTEPENRLLGQSRDRLVNEAKAATRSISGRVRTAAKASLDAATEAARDEGLLPESGGPTIAEKVERVASAAIQETKQQLTSEEQR